MTYVANFCHGSQTFSLIERFIPGWINSSLSQSENLSSVIQRNGIGSTMFVMFINDLIDALKRFGVSVKSLAEKLKVYIRRPILNNCDVLQLLCPLDALTN